MGAVLTRPAGYSIAYCFSYQYVIIFVSRSYLTTVSKLMFYKCVSTVVIGTVGHSDVVYFIFILSRVVVPVL